jgi:hypothetical protein
MLWQVSSGLQVHGPKSTFGCLTLLGTVGCSYRQLTRGVFQSVGCIFAELMARQPMFPGNDYIDQLRIICQKLGKEGRRPRADEEVGQRLLMVLRPATGGRPRVRQQRAGEEVHLVAAGKPIAELRGGVDSMRPPEAS